MALIKVSETTVVAKVGGFVVDILRIENGWLISNTTNQVVDKNWEVR